MLLGTWRLPPSTARFLSHSRKFSPSQLDSSKAASRHDSSEFARRRARVGQKTRGSLPGIKRREREYPGERAERRRVLEHVRAPPRSYVGSGNVRDVPAGRITKLISRPLNSTSDRKIHPSRRMLLFACDFPVCYRASRALPTASSGHFIVLSYGAEYFLYFSHLCEIQWNIHFVFQMLNKNS